MPTSDKKLAAALAAVEQYLEEEAGANAPPAFVAPPPTEPNQWALQGRSEQMSGRQLMQLRAFKR